MAKANFAACLAEVLQHEGGFTLNRKDPGNWTGGKVGSGDLKGSNKGIAAASYPQLDIKNLTDAKIASIYQARYWSVVRGDELPIGIDLSTMDYGVNSGPRRSAKDLQRVLGVKADGRIGPVTLLALEKAIAREVVKAHCAKRLGFVQSLAIWNTFGRGWSRRIAGVEATALAWISTKYELQADSKQAKGRAVSQAGGALAIPGAGVADQAGGMSGLPIGWVIAAVVIIGATLAVRTIVNAQRASALALAAKEM